MSGIGGIVYFDGRTVTPDTLRRFIDVCAHRGPHGRGIWVDASAGLAMRLLDPGADEPSSPAQLDLHEGGLVVVADARLDNRGELLATLELDAADDSELSCADLIRSAYGRWGDQCTEHLLGDFAFAVWDARARRLFCARDHFGVRPFYYALTERALVFASELKSILALGEIPRRINEGRVAEYVAGIFVDNTSTFFEGMSRLPPGHALVVEGSTATIRRYWALQRVEAPAPGTIDEHVQRFQEVFYEAVRCRMPVDQPVGVLLSGGLDSSSVAAAMMEILPQEEPPRLHAFSAVFETLRECDESDYIKAVLESGGAIWHPTTGEKIGPFTHAEAILAHQDEPYGGPNLFMVWALYARTRAIGVGTLLDGYDGDTTLSHGLGHLHELAIAGRWISLAMQLRGVAETHSANAWHALWSLYRVHRLRPFLQRSPWNLVGRSYRRVRRSLARGAREPEAHPAQVAPLVNPELARRVHLDERYREWHNASPERARSGAEEHYRRITGHIQPFALEVFDRTAAAFSLENPHPFWDKRLVEVSLALPAELRLERGWSRMVLRRAMSDVLPEKVVWRRSKADFAANVRNGLISLDADRVEKLFDDRGLEIVADYLDLDHVRESYQRLRFSGEKDWRRDLSTVWTVFSLALWLRRQEES